VRIIYVDAARDRPQRKRLTSDVTRDLRLDRDGNFHPAASFPRFLSGADARGEPHRSSASAAGDGGMSLVEIRPASVASSRRRAVRPGGKCRRAGSLLGMERSSEVVAARKVTNPASHGGRCHGHRRGLREIEEILRKMNGPRGANQPLYRPHFPSSTPPSQGDSQTRCWRRLCRRSIC